MARTGMADLIQELRTRTFAGTADWTLGTVSYWSDNQLQSVLDKHRTDFFEVELMAQEEIHAAAGDASAGGTVQYKRYVSPLGNLEAIDSGTAYFALKYSNGGTVTQSYTVDYFAGRIDFTADQGGTVINLTGRSFDVNEAAADVWAAKASYYASAYDVQTDSHGLKRSQLYAQAKAQEAYFRSLAGARVLDMERSDTL